MADQQPTQEQWLPVPGWEDYYEVSDHGRVRSLDRMIHPRGAAPYRKPGRVLKLSPSKSGHMRAIFTLNGEAEIHYVHRLVLTAFIGQCPDGMEACHWNDNPADNRLVNLRWATRSENMYDRTRNGIDNNGTKNATHCKRGHAYDDENTITYKDGHRACRTCKNAADRRRRAAKRKARAPRTHCKRGHRLEAPNLRIGQLPRRDCRACHRASAHVRRYGLQDQLQEISDRYYEQLIK